MLAIFGAPIEHPDASGAALAAARELHDDLLPVIGDAEFGIGVWRAARDRGHIGAGPLRYTVIGDPVNEAAWLTSWPSCWNRATSWHHRTPSSDAVDAETL